MLAACASGPSNDSIRPATLSSVKIGKPYQVGGAWYTPKDDHDYNETGVASWYGPGFHGKLTASGEPYDMDGISAAHKTLPLPSFVEVTNLSNQRSLLVRINDRGPFVDDRIIDLSRRAAQLLGLDRAGTGRVRVKRVYPSATEMAALTPRRAPKPPVPAVAVAATPPPQTDDHIFIQVAAVSDPDRASGLADLLKSYAPTGTERTPTGLYRVRLGPFPTRDAALEVLAQVHAAGYEEARVVGTGPTI